MSQYISKKYYYRNIFIYSETNTMEGGVGLGVVGMRDMGCGGEGGVYINAECQW